MLWHDHATLLGSGYVLVTVNVLYDEDVSKISDQEYQEKISEAIHKGYVQHCIKEPYVYIMAAKGKFGRQSGVLEPFKSLSLDQVRQELRVRNIYHTSKTKKEAEAILTDTLKGVQRMPSILITNPTTSLGDLHLQHYTILGSEPLHDLKGHLSNVFTELPYVNSQW